MSKVPTSCFDTDTVDAQRRYDAFRESIGVVFEVSNPEHKGSDFRAKIQSRLLNDLMLVECASVGQVFHRTPKMIASDGIDHFLIQTFDLGGTRRIDSQGDQIGEPGKIIVIDASQPWKARNVAFHNITLVIPRDALAGKLLHPDGHHGRLIDETNPFGKILHDFILSLRETLPKVAMDEVHMLVEPSKDLVAAALNHATHVDMQGNPSATFSQNYGLKTRIKRFLNTNIHDPDLDVNRLLDHFRISRSHLYRLFDNEGGIATALRDRRLDLACKRLMFPSHENASIADIARSVGYRNESAFCRSFRQRFSMTPREVQSQGLKIFLARQRASQTNGREWESWFRDL